MLPLHPRDVLRDAAVLVSTMVEAWAPGQHCRICVELAHAGLIAAREHEPFR
jgi:hypothetical protein